ncbi:MAG: hypothetical protein AUH71_01040 [Thaumarchaeota archaeon 13_1_40CM_4_48_7]|nr:MAG: hypothetical protein AUH71_01040 [Thaumarchaeota archaeon 13_1_40CM_4_48_7]
MVMLLDASGASPSSDDILVKVTSPTEVHGSAGQIIRIEGTISNVGSKSTSNSGGIAYISIVDLVAKVPVDLEDWSAEKGLYIPSIEPGQSLPLEWNVRLVKAGSYTIDILFNRDSDLSSPPFSSSKIFLTVQPKFNLNPENILPVAFGVPAVLLAILGSVNYYRGRKTGIYG